MGKKTAAKLAEAAESEAIWERLLKNNNSTKTKRSGSKKKTVCEIKKLVKLPDYVEGWEIRDEECWKATSYNVEKQRISFIKHLFIKYDTPLFLLKALDGGGATRYFTPQLPLIIDWLLVIGQGGSFRKTCKNYLNKKEAHTYLNAPNYNSPTQNFWWAKCATVGIPNNFTSILLERIFDNMPIMRLSDYNNFYKDYVLFFSKYYQSIDKDTFIQIVDFIRVSRANGAFSMKGRTLSSIIRMSNEWHRTSIKLKKGRITSWDGLDVDDYSNFYEHRKWRIKQLKTSRALYKEGQAQRHCVGSYARSCAKGYSSIFSMDSCKIYSGAPSECYDKNVTIEVNNGTRNIYQVKGRLNRNPTNVEKTVLRKWAGENGLRL